MQGGRLLLAIAVTCAAAASASGQKPPSPTIAMPTTPRPRLVHDRLEMSFCTYPPPALRQQIEGCCRMSVEVGLDGKAGRMSGECTHDVFLEPSKSCLLPQAFRPAMLKGKAVRGTGDIVVEYHLASDEKPPVIVFLEQVFPGLKRPLRPRETPEICKPRPGDLIAALDRLRGG